jgi:hypothetical protein
MELMPYKKKHKRACSLSTSMQRRDHMSISQEMRPQNDTYFTSMLILVFSNSSTVTNKYMLFKSISLWQPKVTNTETKAK